MARQAVRYLRHKFGVLTIVVVGGAAVGLSLIPLTASDATAGALSCYDYGCNSHVSCQGVGCDLCHTDNRCGLVPPSE